MIDREALFRDEALEFRARSRETSGTVVRLGAPWIRWSYRLALALVAVGVALAASLRTTTSANGSALVNGTDATFSALVPAVVAPDLGSAEAMRIELRTPGSPTFEARVTGATAVAPNAAVAGLPRPDEPAILLRGRVTTPGGQASSLPRERDVPARATIVLRSERVGEVVLRQLREMFGSGGRNG